MATYRVKPGCEAQFRAVLGEHRQRWQKLNLVTDRPWIWMRSYVDPKLIVEVFEWRSAEAVEAAHRNPEVLALWGRMEQLCEIVGVPLRELPEAAEQFPHFEAFEP